LFIGSAAKDIEYNSSRLRAFEWQSAEQTICGLFYQNNSFEKSHTRLNLKLQPRSEVAWYKNITFGKVPRTTETEHDEHRMISPDQLSLMYENSCLITPPFLA
jgi:hypothetical protein